MTNQRISIRPAGKDDAELLVQFNCAMARQTEGRELDVALLRKGVAGLRAHPEYGFYVVAEIDGAVAGSLMVTHEWSDWRSKNPTRALVVSETDYKVFEQLTLI